MFAPPLWLSIPFVLTLLAIALFPMLAPHRWERHTQKLVIMGMLAVPVAVYLALAAPEALGHSLEDYLSFLILLSALFVISGGIVVNGDLKAYPSTNTIMLAIGAVLANVIGTTGASMILIRLFLRTNSERTQTRHLPVFFIFVVSNIAGLLTPLGDPPLFLGYLKGVPFFWTLNLLPQWLMGVGLTLAIFYLWDRRAFHREPKAALIRDRQRVEAVTIQGKRNLIFLAGVVLAVFANPPIRELLMIVMAIGSYLFGPKKYRQANHFNFNGIIEVAILFAGIFITMIPSLAWLNQNAVQLGISKPWHFFWLSGSLSSFLDNAPTYLTFLSLAQGLHVTPEIVGTSALYLAAISTGAVCMGAMSYIGNAPNFMVKIIADERGYKTPSFFGYMGYSISILSPIFIVMTFLFFR